MVCVPHYASPLLAARNAYSRAYTTSKAQVNYRYRSADFELENRLGGFRNLAMQKTYV